MARPEVATELNISVHGAVTSGQSRRNFEVKKENPMNHKIINSIRRAQERGMTLIEIMIVVSIIAMVAAGVAVVAIPKMKDAQIQTAETGARVIRNAVSQWQLAENEYSECPTVSRLIEDKQLDSGQSTVDPWGQEYVINCGEDEVVVSSGGPDKKAGGKDDIVVPKGAAAGESEQE